jgi:hypothetical protein
VWLDFFSLEFLQAIAFDLSGGRSQCLILKNRPTLQFFNWWLGDIAMTKLLKSIKQSISTKLEVQNH